MKFSKIIWEQDFVNLRIYNINKILIAIINSFPIKRHSTL